VRKTDMAEQAILKKLDSIEQSLTNHLMTEIKENRSLMNTMFQELVSIRESLQAHAECIGVINDRYNKLIAQLRRVNVIS
jgi:hypothetical protein